MTQYLRDLSKTEDHALLSKVVRDFIIRDETSSLGTSNDLRSRIGAMLCQYLNIEERYVIQLILSQTQISATRALKNPEYRRIAVGSLLLNKFKLTYEEIKDFDPKKTEAIAMTVKNETLPYSRLHLFDLENKVHCHASVLLAGTQSLSKLHWVLLKARWHGILFFNHHMHALRNAG